MRAPAVSTDWPPISMAVAELMRQGLMKIQAVAIMAGYAADRAGPFARRDEASGVVQIVELSPAEIAEIDWSDGSSRARRLMIPGVELLHYSPPLFVNGAALQAYAARHLARPAQAARTGRPPRYDWASAGIELACWVHHAGIPDPLAPLVEHLQLHLASADGTGPDERDVRRWLNRALARVRAPLKGEK